MAKQTGLGARLLVDGYNISGDVTSVGTIGGGPALLECTGIDKEAFERKGGLLDGGMEFTTWWNPGPEANAAHLVLAELPYSDRCVSFLTRNLAGAWAASVLAKQVSYDHSRGDDGAFTAQTSVQASNGYPLEWGRLITPGIVSLTEAGEGDGWDSGSAETEFGAVAYLHVLGFTGTSITVKVQDSDDGSTWADLSGATFAAATDIGSQRIEVAGDVRQHLRIVSSGTFSAADVVVSLYRRESEPT